MHGPSLDALRKGFDRARERRQPWEPLWRGGYKDRVPLQACTLFNALSPLRPAIQNQYGNRTAKMPPNLGGRCQM